MREIPIPRNDVRPIIAIVGGAVGMTTLFDEDADQPERLIIFSNADGYKLGLWPNIKNPLGAVLPGVIIIARFDHTSMAADYLTDNDMLRVKAWLNRSERPEPFTYPDKMINAVNKYTS